MELNHLKYFYIVAREGGFTKAAYSLRVQQPAISKIVKQLEEELGLVLLERGKRSISLTKAGKDIFDQCEKIFGCVDEIKVISDSEKTECTGPLLFGTSDSMAVYLVPGLISDFIKTNPKVIPSIFAGNSTQISQELLEGRIEFGIYYTLPGDEHLFDIVDIGRMPVALVVSARHQKQTEVRRSYISSREIDYSKTYVTQTRRMLTAYDPNLEIKVMCNNFDAQKNMVLEGLGISLLLEYMVRDEIKKKQLISLPTPRELSYTIRLVTKKGKVLSRNSRLFIEYFLKKLPSLGAKVSKGATV